MSQQNVDAMPTLMYPFLLAEHLDIQIKLHRSAKHQGCEAEAVAFIERVLLAGQGLSDPSEFKELQYKNASNT